MAAAMTERGHGARDRRSSRRAPAVLGAARHDALQALANAGIGVAGARLACLLGRHVTLSIPRIGVADPERLKEEIERRLGAMRGMVAFRQSFRADIAGESLVFFARDGARELCEALYGRQDLASESGESGECGESGQGGGTALRGLLPEVANVLAGACVCGLLGQLGRVPAFSVPRETDAAQIVGAIARSGNPAAGSALLLDLHVRIEDRRFRACLAALLARSAFGRLCAALDATLDSL